MTHLLGVSALVYITDRMEAPAATLTLAQLNSLSEKGRRQLFFGNI